MWLFLGDDAQVPLLEVVTPDTDRLHRALAAKPEKVYRAFLEANALAK